MKGEEERDAGSSVLGWKVSLELKCNDVDHGQTWTLIGVCLRRRCQCGICLDLMIKEGET